MELKPGWNLIASPFDFPTDWNAVQKPPLVETQLWAFDGKQYLANDNVMQPWQGYFVRNLSEQPQLLVFPPPCAECSQILPQHAAGESSSFLHASTTATPAFPAASAQMPFIWQLQLCVRGGGFSDTQNWLGVAAHASEEWDELELSEPPPAAGEHVALCFPQEHWQKLPGIFTTDFRPPATAAQKWVFEVFTTQAGQALTLDFQLAGEFPGEGKMLLQDDNGLVRQIDFDENGRAQTLSLRGSTAPRRWTLWAGTRDDFDKTGLLAAALPQAFALAPSYPNPAKLQAHGQAASTMRFSVPMAAEVELTIWNVRGLAVRTLLRRQWIGPGHHEILWNGRNDAGQVVAAGVYFCRMKTGQFNAVQKIILLH